VTVDTFHDGMIRGSLCERQGRTRESSINSLLKISQRMKTKFASNSYIKPRYRGMRQPPLLRRAKSLPLILDSEAAMSKPLFWFRPLKTDRSRGQHARITLPSNVKATRKSQEKDPQRDDTEGPEDELAGLRLLEAEEPWQWL
jgi:hypothetical protein